MYGKGDGPRDKRFVKEPVGGFKEDKKRGIVTSDGTGSVNLNVEEGGVRLGGGV